MNLDGILADYEVLDALRTPPLDEAKAARLAELVALRRAAHSIQQGDEERALYRELYEAADRQKISVRLRHRTTGRLVRLESREENE